MEGKQAYFVCNSNICLAAAISAESLSSHLADKPSLLSFSAGTLRAWGVSYFAASFLYS